MPVSSLRKSSSARREAVPISIFTVVNQFKNGSTVLTFQRAYVPRRNADRGHNDNGPRALLQNRCPTSIVFDDVPDYRPVARESNCLCRQPHGPAKQERYRSDCETDRYDPAR